VVMGVGVVEEAVGDAEAAVVTSDMDVSHPKTGYIPRSLLFQWHVTERCNLRCQHCYQDGIPSSELDFDSLLDILEQFKALLANFRAHQPVPAHITLTGGEPFVRKDFPKLVELISSQPELFSFAILTNGTFIDRAIASWLSCMKPAFIQVSLDGMQSTHDQIRGAGNFEQTITSIRNLRAEKVPIAISFTAQRQNYREFLDVAQLGRELNVQLVWSDRVIPAGHNQKELEVQALSTTETRAWLDVMSQAHKDGKLDPSNCTEIGLNRALQFWVGNNQPYRCSAGDSLISLLPNGDLVPCRRMPIVVGNVLEQPMT
ncbi:MAG TPA: radical SAM protein, partial [Anaerolineales bacterium]|nr:radical SAM protein [Anaerolineales bacterium]